MFTVTRERLTWGPRTTALSRGNLGMRWRPPRSRHLARATPERSRKKEKIKNFHVALTAARGGGVDPGPGALRSVTARTSTGEKILGKIVEDSEKKNEIFKITGEKFEIKNLNFHEIKNLNFLFYPPPRGLGDGWGGAEFPVRAAIFTINHGGDFYGRASASSFPAGSRVRVPPRGGNHFHFRSSPGQPGGVRCVRPFYLFSFVYLFIVRHLWFICD